MQYPRAVWIQIATANAKYNIGGGESERCGVFTVGKSCGPSSVGEGSNAILEVHRQKHLTGG